MKNVMNNETEQQAQLDIPAIKERLKEVILTDNVLDGLPYRTVCSLLEECPDIEELEPAAFHLSQEGYSLAWLYCGVGCKYQGGEQTMPPVDPIETSIASEIVEGRSKINNLNIKVGLLHELAKVTQQSQDLFQEATELRRRLLPDMGRWTLEDSKLVMNNEVS